MAVKIHTEGADFPSSVTLYVLPTRPNTESVPAYCDFCGDIIEGPLAILVTTPWPGHRSMEEVAHYRHLDDLVTEVVKIES